MGSVSDVSVGVLDGTTIVDDCFDGCVKSSIMAIEQLAGVDLLGRSCQLMHEG